MAIDISHRKNNHINKITISNKPQKGMSFFMLSAAAFILVAAGTLPERLLVNTAIYILCSAISFGAIPIIAFLVAETYRNTKNLRKTAIILGLVALVSHIPYVILADGIRPYLLYNVNLSFPIFMGFMALGLQDKSGISATAKTVIALLICIICTIADNGSILVVWTLIFGSRHDITTKRKLFYTLGIISVVLNIIFSISSWQYGLCQLGFLLAVPFIRFYNSQKVKLWGGLAFLILYSFLLTGLKMISFLI